MSEQRIRPLSWQPFGSRTRRVLLEQNFKNPLGGSGRRAANRRILAATWDDWRQIRTATVGGEIAGDVLRQAGRGPRRRNRGLCLTRKRYIAGAAGAAAFLARRFAGFFAAFLAGFLAAFFATFRFAGLRPAFFAVFRAGFFAAALRTVDFFAAFLRAGFLFAVIGIETTPSRVRESTTGASQKLRKYEEVGLTKQY